MGGTIDVAGTWWSARSGIFSWVVDLAADEVAHAGAAAVLREVSVENLGWLDLAELEPATRDAVLGVLAGLAAPAGRTLPVTPHREDVLEQVRELADLAARALGRTPDAAQPGGAQSS